MQNIKMNLDSEKRLLLIGKAFSAEVRIDILKLLCHSDMNINEISEALTVPQSSVAAHIKVLEDAGIISTNLLPGIRGTKKMCHIEMTEIALELSTRHRLNEKWTEIDMPIGNYVDYKVRPTCGIVSEKAPIGEEDEPRCFYNPDRSNAQLLWLGKGYVEYRFPNDCMKDKKEKALEVSAELCSEDHEYNLACKSDITMWINDVEVGTWSCPSDFGGRRGKLNPEWWPDKNTQYGKLKTWKIDENASYIDDEKTSENGIDKYNLYDKEYISVRIGIKENAKNVGGINLFGKCFGDYEQNIKMRIKF